MADACPRFEEDLAGGRPVIGVDEVGRGPLAGPVVAAAAYLPDTRAVAGLRDSKALSEAQRRKLAAALQSCAVVSVAAASAMAVDEIGIERATHLAMQRAVARLAAPGRALVVVDGTRAPSFEGRDSLCQVKADARCPSVAAAAIVAKILRDRAMVQLAARHAHYGWSTNKGYGSAQHRAAIRLHGPTRHHRRSFLTRILDDVAG